MYKETTRLYQVCTEKLKEWDTANKQMEDLIHKLVQVEPGVILPSFIVGEEEIRDSERRVKNALKEFIKATRDFWMYKHAHPQ